MMNQAVKMILFSFLFWTVAFLPYATFSYTATSFKTVRQDIDSKNLVADIAHETNRQVVASDWLTLNEEDWSVISPSQISHSIRILELVQESYSRGIVLVYHRSDVTEPLPFVSVHQLKVNYGTAVDMLWIEASHKKGRKIDMPIGSDFRYVLIPKEKMESKELSQRKIKRMAYAEVIALFGLEG